MKKCRHCDKHFEPTNGNQAYCSPEHKDFLKSANQHKIYALIKEFRNGYINNHRLFERLLKGNSNKTVPLSELIAAGFKHNCYFGKSETSNNEVFYWVGDYYFTLFKEKEIQQIKIIKNK